MAGPPPPSYEEAVRGECVPSAPPASAGGPSAPPAPFPHQAQPASYPQPAYAQGRAPSHPEPPLMLSQRVQPPAQGQGRCPQYSHPTVQGGMGPSGGYQFIVNRPNVNPLNAGYQTTPLAIGNAGLPARNARACKLIMAFLMVLFVIITITIVFSIFV